MWSLEQNLVYNNSSVNVKHCCYYNWSTGEQTDIQGVCVCARSHVHIHTHRASITQLKPLDSADFLALLKTPGPQ